ncbi:DUF4167 domain-containing protein [Futiania mangrovi]|uniref:DUF4167 domain-containing protein n=1 Tax=Futiania mangrovi TaxID=2959716 RepID=A0A9J6P8Q0_9PROT|nr:DUF4167 domain-containing protein [Futiania mangrovii]MCP1336132.1 DUF4167 domain-containing protein [Futiania mangrovii]
MRQGQNAKRSRGRGRRGGGQGFSLNRVFESNGPDVKVRGTVQQVYEKYLNLSRDSNSAGDRIAAETYMQHAEHYFRLMCAMQAQSGQPRNMAQAPVQGYEPQPEIDTTPGAQGRDEDDDGDEDEDEDQAPAEAQVVRRFDRDSTAQEAEQQQDAGRAASRHDEEAEAAQQADVPRRRGRPRRRPDGDVQPQQDAAPAPSGGAAEAADGSEGEAADAAPKRRRGRPRKVQAEAKEPVSADN